MINILLRLIDLLYKEVKRARVSNVDIWVARLESFQHSHVIFQYLCQAQTVLTSRLPVMVQTNGIAHRVGLHRVHLLPHMVLHLPTLPLLAYHTTVNFITQFCLRTPSHLLLLWSLHKLVDYHLVPENRLRTLLLSNIFLPASVTVLLRTWLLTLLSALLSLFKGKLHESFIFCFLIAIIFGRVHFL